MTQPVDLGFLYVKPRRGAGDSIVDEVWGAMDGWIPLGLTDGGTEGAIEANELAVYEPFRDFGTVKTVAFELGPITPLSYWLLLRRTHPRIRRMHQLYRRRRR